MIFSNLFILDCFITFGIFYSSNIITNIFDIKYFKRENIFQDKFNIFFIASFLMVLSSLIHSFNRDYIPYEVNPNLSWIGLANWIPFFWCYFGFEISQFT